MRFFDTHNHLQDERLVPMMPEVLARAREAGVLAMACCAADQSDWPLVLDLAARHNGILPFLGVHCGCLASRTPDWRDRLERTLLAHPEAGVGETGLDHVIQNRDDAEQETVFLEQLRLAQKLQRPLSIHCRRAFGRLLELLRQEGVPAGTVLHTYSGPPELVPAFQELGCFFSFSAALTRAGSKRPGRAVAAVSSDRLLLETDCPDLAPAGLQDRPNEPAHIRLVAEASARFRHTTLEDIAEQTWINACRCFAGLLKFRPMTPEKHLACLS